MMSKRRQARRRMIASISIGATLSITPVVAPWPSAGVAAAPAIAVTGLSRGSQGDAVKHVQQALLKQGLDVAGGADGVFGPGTETALKRFQAGQGLNSSGVVDDATALALGLATSPLLGLSLGDRGPAVEQLQKKLESAGITVGGGADGIFGPGTEQAVEAFQSAKGYSPTGIVNAATAAVFGGVQIVETATSSDGSASKDEPSASSEAKAETKAETKSETKAESKKTGDSGAKNDADTPAPQAASNDLIGLKIGARNDQVKVLQTTIMAAGFTVVGGADGIFGALTANALKSFQNANGIEASGVVDKATAAVLAIVRARTAGKTDAKTHDHDPQVSNPYVGLRYGSIGADVKSLQGALMSAGLALRGGADGVYGRATEAAVSEYQAKVGLKQTGNVDEATANTLSSGATTSGKSPLTGLKAGALGNTVKSLQQALIDAGVTVRGGADGIFGPATANALRTFQTSQGLEATGVVDQATGAALAKPKAADAPSSAANVGGFAGYGEKGARVLALQSALVKAGVPVRGGVDGVFGGGTSAAVMDFQRVKGFSVTGKVNDGTAAALGLGPLRAPAAPSASNVELKVFPVQGYCQFGDSFGYPRGGGRVHLGVDIIAAEGKLLYAVADGTITKIYADYPGSLPGNGIRLTMADGTYFFYAHMLGIGDGIEVGAKVKAGRVVGAVGNTGSSGTNHLHLEIHPLGGSAVNPYPLVKAIDGCANQKPLPQP